VVVGSQTLMASGGGGGHRGDRGDVGGRDDCGG